MPIRNFTAEAPRGVDVLERLRRHIVRPHGRLHPPGPEKPVKSLPGHAVGDHSDYGRNGNAQPANAGNASHLLRVYCYTGKFQGAAPPISLLPRKGTNRPLDFEISLFEIITQKIRPLGPRKRP